MVAIQTHMVATNRDKGKLRVVGPEGQGQGKGQGQSQEREPGEGGAPGRRRFGGGGGASESRRRRSRRTRTGNQRITSWLRHRSRITSSLRHRSRRTRTGNRPPAPPPPQASTLGLRVATRRNFGRLVRLGRLGTLGLVRREIPSHFRGRTPLRCLSLRGVRIRDHKIFIFARVGLRTLELRIAP